MPRIVRTARGEMIDFDTIIIKQQLAEAPMNIEVARRKQFIDSKEGKVRGSKPELVADPQVLEVDPVLEVGDELDPPEISVTPQPVSRKKIRPEPEPDLPKRD